MLLKLQLMQNFNDIDTIQQAGSKDKYDGISLRTIIISVPKLPYTTDAYSSLVSTP